MGLLIDFYDAKVMQAIQEWPIGIKAKFTWIAELIREHGIEEVGMPYVKPLGNGLFEIRAKGKEGIGRAIFCLLKGKKLVILNEFIKKTQKTPKDERILASKRMKEVKFYEKET